MQDSADTRAAVYGNARRVKANDYPRKDEDGRLLNQSGCLPFILTSMGGLCKEGHEFLRICRKRNPVAASHMIDVLISQHSRWSARRLHRALFGQSLINFSGTDWAPRTQIEPPEKISFRGKGTAKQRATSLFFDRLKRQMSCEDSDELHSSQERTSRQSSSQSKSPTIEDPTKASEPRNALSRKASQVESFELSPG